MTTERFFEYLAGKMAEKIDGGNGRCYAIVGPLPLTDPNLTPTISQIPVVRILHGTDRTFSLSS